MSSGQPLVSIIMNCYNGERFLKEAIDSVYMQTYSNWEIVFWDNASNDNSGEIAKSYDQRLKYSRSEVTTPLGEARNLAMKKATGKYIAFLDCDDLYFPDKLEKQVSIMEQSKYPMSYGSALYINETGDIIRNFLVKYKSGYIFGDLLKRYEINMQSVMILGSLLKSEKINFQTNLQYCPDHNLFMEIASRVPVAVIQDIIVKYRVASNSLSQRTLHLASAEVRYTLDSILERDKEITDKFPEQIKEAYAKVKYYDALNYISQGMYKKARIVLKEIARQRWEYSVLFFVLIFPFPKKILLRLLKR